LKNNNNNKNKNKADISALSKAVYMEMTILPLGETLIDLKLQSKLQWATL
jgi:hypothetical protein